jgi:hexosaminidase
MADTQARLNVAPIPADVQPGTGSLVVDPSFSVGIVGYKEARLDRAVHRFLSSLSRQTGMPLTTKLADPAKAVLVVRADHPSKPVQEVDEDESYILEVTTSGARLTAPNPLGVLHGLETFLQLIETTPDGFCVPAVRIRDQPRFRWRGLLIDVCRHFFPLDALKRNLDGMAAVKLNVLHLHLSENQGFRVESKAFPKLHEMGSDGFSYTQAEIRDLVEYAHDRGIRVVPEFDMPGHSTSWFVGYPEIASAPGPYILDRKWGVFDPAMDPTREQTYRFLDEFIREMAELFPDRYLHTGGDEVNGKQWDANPKIQEFKRLHHLDSNHDLQQYFNERIQKIVAKHCKIMIGWDEILSPNLPRDIVIQSWRGPDSLAQAAKLGYDGILSAGYYLNLMAHASDHYQVDPLGGAAAGLAPEEKARILGGEACMWSEYVSPDNLDSRIWPRTVAIAERLWSPETVQDVDSLYRRMGAVSWRLEWLGLTHRSSYVAMLGRLAGTDDIAALRVLADVVEPDKGYSRSRWASSMGIVFTSATPLHHLTDAVAPESEGAQNFTNAVNALVSSKFSDTASEAQVRAQLISWRDNYARLQPLLDRSFLLKEVTPLSQDLASLGRAGLQALDYIDRGERTPEAWRAQRLAVIDQAKKPRANLLLATASAVQVLVEASAESTQKAP